MLGDVEICWVMEREKVEGTDRGSEKEEGRGRGEGGTC